MWRLSRHFDLHVVYMLLLLAPASWLFLLLAPASWLGWWWLAITLLAPQGRIGVRMYVDYPAFGRQPWAYLIANEVLVFGAVGVVAGLWGAA